MIQTLRMFVFLNLSVIISMLGSLVAIATITPNLFAVNIALIIYMNFISILNLYRIMHQQDTCCYYFQFISTILSIVLNITKLTYDLFQLKFLSYQFVMLGSILSINIIVASVIYVLIIIHDIDSRYPLPIKPITEIPGDFSCSICLETEKTNCVITTCKHIFHTDCIKPWFQQNPTCPICRTVLIFDDTITPI